ncbi:MAG: TIGR04283 family arsenosugar biosynthesis glycosyltransferase [Snowella sp.]|nr:TIGR04283 family arsenosugar biosynthesis glycosyltransferase [Snowella sp.]
MMIASQIFPQPLLSIIIPVFNEAKIAKFYLEKLEKLESNDNLELLIIDGGSRDHTVEICQAFPVKVLISPQKGRAAQMNLGAKQAQGKFLLFLHLDSELPNQYLIEIQQILNNPKNVAGAFKFQVDSAGFTFRLLEYLVNLRSHFLGLPYGDQGLFIKAETFGALGGFKNLPIMEDYELIQRLKQQGQIAIANTAIRTSGRRWQKFGIMKTTLINQLIILGYHLQIPPQTLAKWYRGR